MSFYDFYRRFFDDVLEGKRAAPDVPLDSNKPNDSFWISSEEEKNMRDFKFIIDPIEMQVHIQQTMDDMFKNFAPFVGFPGMQGPSIFVPPNVPAIGGNENPRDHYLKPGLNKKQDADEERQWTDRNLPSHSQDKNFQPWVSFSSVTRKTVTMPDGSVKTEEVIRSGDGSEQRTESHTLPDENKSPFNTTQFDMPNFSDLFEPNPGIQKSWFIKPGYEELHPNEEKMDKNLDKQILQSGVESLTSLPKASEIIDFKQKFAFFKIVTKKTLPSGVVESEEVVRNPDGTEQRIVTRIFPDGTTTNSPNSDFQGYNNQGTIKLNREGENDKPVLSLALRGVKDFLDILFK